MVMLSAGFRLRESKLGQSNCVFGAARTKVEKIHGS